MPMDSEIPPHFRAKILALMTKLFLIGAGFAIYLIMALFCLRFILFDIHDPRSRSRNILLAFISISTAAVATDFIGSFAADSSLLLCSLDSEKPLRLCNNPNVDQRAFRRDIAITVAEAVMYTLADGMLYYRAIIIWQRNMWIICLAGLLFIGSEGFQIFGQVMGFDDLSNIVVQAASFWLIAFYDIFISSLIIGRLMYYRRNAKVTERQDSIAIYTSLAAVFFEASLFLSSTRILYAALLVTNKQYLYGFWTPILTDLAAAISPLFIILRLALNSFDDPYNLKLRDKPVKRQNDVESNIVFAQAPTSSPSRTGVMRTILLGTTRSAGNVRSVGEGITSKNDAHGYGENEHVEKPVQ